MVFTKDETFDENFQLIKYHDPGAKMVHLENDMTAAGRLLL